MTVPWDWTSISKIFQILVKIWGCDSEVMLTNSCGKYFNRLVEFFVCLKYHLNTTKHAVQLILQAPNLKSAGVALLLTSEYFEYFCSLSLCHWTCNVCLCEPERGISPFGPALLFPSEQPGQGTQAQFGGSQHHLNCKENRKSTSGSVPTLW